MAILTTPDLFNIYTLVDINQTGIATLPASMLHLPEKASYIIFNELPDGGTLKINNSQISVGTTQITKAEIESGLLQLFSDETDTTLLIDISYLVYEESGALISLLNVYYPPDIVQDISINRVDGGNFLTGANGFGVSPDGGDFDTAVLVINGYSYEGGNFDTGERVGIAPPPTAGFNFYEDGELNPEIDSIVTLLDENFDPIQTAELPNSQYIDSSVLLPDLLFNIDYTIELEIGYATKYFEGFNYGSFAPNAGYDIDYGSLNNANTEGYDFNSITNYQEPVPLNSVS
ncbi:MAG: hypothetical protein ACO24P_00695 [Candidatus Nanopelagicaceae bacterium]